MLKPRQGAGSQDVFRVDSPDELRRLLTERGGGREMIVQHFVAGRPASVLALVGSRQTWLFPPATQQLSDDGRFRYLGGRVPLDADQAGAAQRLAGRLLNSLQSPPGIYGIDLVLNREADGGWIIEVNARLTTSYVGLRALTASNLAAVILAVARGEAVPSLTWRNGPVVFHPDGSISDHCADH